MSRRETLMNKHILLLKDTHNFKKGEIVKVAGFRFDPNYLNIEHEDGREGTPQLYEWEYVVVGKKTKKPIDLELEIPKLLYGKIQEDK